MVDQKKKTSGISIIIAIIAALLAGQIASSYEISLIPSTIITIAIAVIFWYGFNFFLKQNKDNQE
ncbi:MULTISPECIES: hypothetical protein [Bacillaceae]|uniref:hypothetical protein n=1 Tax=Bacillaceae TaxID=186817 RepID=UPI00119FD10E|nr:MULTISPECIES: hypothetical protein [Bacillaceae]MED4473873.1 hypothetical protein [Oceanobacillus caeni]